MERFATVTLIGHWSLSCTRGEAAVGRWGRQSCGAVSACQGGGRSDTMALGATPSHDTPRPEEAAREEIDAALTEAGWVVYRNLQASRPSILTSKRLARRCRGF